jgi:hypothetical protein
MTKIKDLHGFLPQKKVSIVADTTLLKDALSKLGE